MVDIIVVGVDGSIPSLGAVRWGASRAQAHGSHLRLVHVLDDGAGPATSDSEASADSVLRAGEALARSVAGDIPISWRIARGDPLQVMATLAGEDGLLVVGTHKTGFIHGTSFGSRFLALASLARCATAYIPDLAGSVRDGVVAGVLDGGDEAIRWAAEEASSTAQPLTLVRSRPNLPPQLEELAVRAVAVARDVDEILTIRTRRSSRPLAAALVETAARSKLLVLPHPNDPAGVVLVHNVLLNITSPTLVAPV